MNTIELARKLGASIQQETSYIRYQIAKQVNDEDDELQEKIGEFNMLRMKLNTELSKDEKDDEKVQSVNDELRAVYAEIMQNPHMVEFNEAKGALDEIVNYVNSIISLSVNGEDPETCEPSSCSGSCSSCSGCH